jgi:hypothetical protein
MRPSLAYLAQGRLVLSENDAPPRTLESPFGRAVTERALEIDRRHAWKGQGRGANFMSRGLLWGGDSAPSAALVKLSSLSAGRASGELLYSLETAEICGVLCYSVASGLERRLFHSNERRLRQLAASPGQGRIACSLSHDSGSANIALMDQEASNLTEATEGDSVDQAPSWVPGHPDALVFQSAGIARDGSGRPVSLGPASVRRIDLDRGEITTLAEDPRQDCLAPKIDSQGNLLFIRRPYSRAGGGWIGSSLLDLLLLPVRLLRAVFLWLNFFSVRYSGKPLTTAGGPERQGADVKQMMVWGNLIDAERAARESRARGDDTADLVPSSWQLVRRAQDGGTTVLAKGVLAFDCDGDGGVVYSNGSAVYRLGSEGRRERLLLDTGIEQLVVLP